MARKLSTNTINKFKKKLLAEKEQLTQILDITNKKEKISDYPKHLPREVQIQPPLTVGQWLLN